MGGVPNVQSDHGAQLMQNYGNIDKYTSVWVSVISDAVPHRVEAAARRSGSHMVRNHSCCAATANCLFAPYLSIYSLVALVSLGLILLLILSSQNH